MNIVCLDLEGVLVPEIWIAFAQASGIPELKRTTRDEPDYDKLMNWRLGILKEHGLGLKEIQDTIAKIDPIPGAKEFLDELRSITQVIIISDTFTQFATPLMKKLGWPTIFCNSLEVADNGEITGFKMRCEQSKLTTVKALQSIGYDTIASGDSHNDLGMIKASKAGFLFKSTEQIKADNPELEAFDTYDELLAAIKKALSDASKVKGVTMLLEEILKQEQERFIKENLLSDEMLELLKENIMPFNTLMAYYRCAIMEVETKFKVLNEEFSLQYDRNPIESIKSRIKSMDGIFKKAKKKNIPITMEGIEEGIRDIAGVRVICSFPEDIYMLADCLLKQDDVVLVERKDYIKNPKPSGYRSLHLIIEIPIFLQNEKKMMKVEVQLRTIAMDFWASVEHKVRYKKNIPDSEAEQLAAELSSCADQIAAMDNKMEEIRRRIAEAEEREAENNPPKQPQTIGGVMLKKRLESGKFPFKK